MPSFGKRSNENLSGCHKDLRTLFRVVVEELDCAVIQGRRGQAEQDSAYMAGLSKVQYPDSKHNAEPLSLAADVVPYPVDWEDKKRFYYFAGYVIAKSEELYASRTITHRIRWGGNWRGGDLHEQSFMDLPHFELIGAEND